MQRGQFKRLGVFGDWEHPYLTLDPAYETEIIRAFGKLVDKGLVYQSKKPVYWSTGAQTALAEAEVEYHEEDSPAIYVKFPLVSGPLAGKASVVIWTTTPWTLPANQAVAVNAGFGYRAQLFRNPHTGKNEMLLFANALADSFCKATGYTREENASGVFGSFLGSEMEGWKFRHPFLDREGPIILGDFVTLEAGTGCVHIAPGHGNEDFVVGRKYGLAVFSPVDDDGKYTEEVGVPALVGKYVFDANKDVIAMLRDNGTLAGDGVIHHTYPHCWRSKVPIIFRAVEQFFIRMDDLRPEALHAIDGVKWIPHWGRNRIYGTVESRPDWCISRQRAWGVPLPVFYDRAGKPLLRPDWIDAVAILFKQYGTNIWFDPDDKIIAQSLDLPPGTTRRNDTLDVWIDSGVSFQAVVNKMLGVDGPADLYLEATDQHRGWFQSSLIMSVATQGRAPYKECLTHGFVVDVDTRRKISKSEQGQYAKPTVAEHFVNKYGADIVRLWVSSVNFTDEVPFGEEMFNRLSETYRRLRNTLRILLGNLADFDPVKDAVAPDHYTFVDRWISHRLQEVVATCAEAYAAFEFHKVYHTLNQFCAVDLSSLYVDITKDRMYCDKARVKCGGARRRRSCTRSSTRCAGCWPRCARSRRRRRGTSPASRAACICNLPRARRGGGVPDAARPRGRTPLLPGGHRAGGRTGAAGKTHRQRAGSRGDAPRRRRRATPGTGGARRRAGRVFHPERPEAGRRGTRRRFARGVAADEVRAVRALLAASSDGGPQIEAHPDVCDRCADAVDAARSNLAALNICLPRPLAPSPHRLARQPTDDLLLPLPTLRTPFRPALLLAFAVFRLRGPRSRRRRADVQRPGRDGVRQGLRQLSWINTPSS